MKSGPAVLSASYLDRHSTKNNLVRYLREVVNALDDAYVKVNMPDYPGLRTRAVVLVIDHCLDHKDKEVHTYVVLAYIEIFELLNRQTLFNYCDTIIYCIPLTHGYHQTNIKL